MADKKHLQILRKGVKVWNQWRKENPDIKPDLRRANLKRANLRHANLADSNLRRANLRRADLRRADLKRANLKNADLYRTNLYRAYIRSANLRRSNLKHANLKRVQTLSTNFEGAILTGACIEDWNINSQTNLQNVKCDFIYLKLIYFKEEKKVTYRDRRPHDPNKNFAPGEFTKLFQKALETVDLIFSDGIDWQAFLVSFNKLQIECESDELSINSFENKGDGTFVIRVNVPDGADKAEIEKYLKKQYQLEATVEAQQRELSNLYEITKLLAGRATTENRNINIEKGNYNEQSGEFGIGQIEKGDISGNAKVASEINEAGKQDH